MATGQTHGGKGSAVRPTDKKKFDKQLRRKKTKKRRRNDAVR